MIGLGAPDEADAAALAAGAMVGARDLQSGVDRFRAEIGEEHMVEPVGRDGGNPRREFRRRPDATSENDETKSSFAPGPGITATMRGWPWPALTHHSPAMLSGMFQPSAVM